MVKVECEVSGDEWRCRVAVEGGRERTTHAVTVTRDDVGRWAGSDGLGDVADLVRRSFEFLLEREPATSILGSFELSVIQRYFPEYDRLFRRTDR
jgi:hypothetical protein